MGGSHMIQEGREHLKERCDIAFGLSDEWCQSVGLALRTFFNHGDMAYGQNMESVVILYLISTDSTQLNVQRQVPNLVMPSLPFYTMGSWED